MGFLRGFAGGAVVTSVAIYCTLHYHHATRQYQRMLLREQIDAVNGLALPSRAFNSQDQSVLLKQEAYAAVMTRRGYAPRSREEPPNLADIAKEKWNEDVKRFANWLHHVRLEDLRWEVEDGIYHLIRRLRGGQ